MSEKLFIEELFEKSKKKLQLKNQIDYIDKLTGDASTRRYYRLYMRDNSSYVVCLDDPKEEENTFVKTQSFFSDQGIRVPAILDKNVKKGYLLEEDLGDTTLLSKLSQINNVDEELELYKRVIDELVKIHNIKKETIDHSKDFNIAFDYEKLKFEVNFSIKYFMTQYLKIEDQGVLDKVSTLFGPICIRIADAPRVLVHRDFHSRNIMITKESDLVVIDFQDARWGVPQYDLASLFEDCYYKINDSNKEKLKNYYLDQFVNHDDDFNSGFDALYTDMAIQRIFKALGSFGYIYSKRKDERYLKYIGFAIENLRSHMLKDKRYNELRKIIMGHYYES